MASEGNKKQSFKKAAGNTYFSFHTRYYFQDVSAKNDQRQSSQSIKILPFKKKPNNNNQNKLKKNKQDPAH